MLEVVGLTRVYITATEDNKLFLGQGFKGRQPLGVQLLRQLLPNSNKERKKGHLHHCTENTILSDWFRVQLLT